MVTKEAKIRIISCSVLQAELEELVKQGELDADLTYVSKYFHVDYSLLEENLRQTIKENLPLSSQGSVLVYGDLCLGPNNEMKQLAAEYGLTKVDALNCVDCLLGGKRKSLLADPNHDLMLMTSGMSEFFKDVQEQASREGIGDDVIRKLFTGLRGFVIIDTLGEAEKIREVIKDMDTGLPILETKTVGLDNLLQVIREAQQKNQQKRHQY